MSKKDWTSAVALVAAMCAMIAAAFGHSITLQDGSTFRYNGLVSPRGELCCGSQDCGPVEPQNFRRDADGNMWARRPGTYGEAPEGDWHEISLDVVLPVPSPDARVHVCIWGHQVRCVLMPNGD